METQLIVIETNQQIYKKILGLPYLGCLSNYVRAMGNPEMSKKSNSGHVVVINDILLLSKRVYDKRCFEHNLKSTIQ
jgi:hypothetical protein